MLRRSIILALMAGCYAPSPPSGAYRCATDGRCPTGQQCQCGLCVYNASEAACGFSLDVSGAGSRVFEHQSFSVTVKALQIDKSTVASGFSDAIALSFELADGTPWGDVSPSTVKLDQGSATAMVSLNRETVPPQQVRLVASFAGNRNASAPIEVRAPPMIKDPMPIVAPAQPIKPFGWADTFVAEPAVMFDGSAFRMYFTGFRLRPGERVSIGVATSTDGRTFSPKMEPVFTPAATSFYSAVTQSSAPFKLTDGSTALAFAGSEESVALNPPSQIGLATSVDGLSTFTVGNGGKPIIKRRIIGVQMADCEYCTGNIQMPFVIDDPMSLQTLDAGLGGKVMFFAASDDKMVPAIGRASSSDGATWTPEPAPVLSGELGGEAVLLAPRVLIDGTVWKMWYSFVLWKDFRMGVPICEIPVMVGYATSSDGFYWVRSPTNGREGGAPIHGEPTGWDAGIKGFVAGAPVPVDGRDPSKGIALYYSTIRDVGGTIGCMVNGIGRATRP